MSSHPRNSSEDMSTTRTPVRVHGAEHRPYQVRTAATLLAEPHENHVVNIPVGGGKTETVIEYIAAAVNAPNREDYTALIVCPNRRLEKQWFDRLAAYGLTDALTVERNQTANTKSRRSNTHFRSRDAGGRELRERAQRLKDWEDNAFNDSKQSQIRDADIFLSTPELLRSDISRDRVSVSDLHDSFTDIIVDEVTNVAAVKDFTVSSDNDAEKTYRVNKNYRAYTKPLQSSDRDTPRLIGLTGMVGERIHTLQSMFDATVIRPALNEVNEYRPDLQRVDPHFARDSRIICLLKLLDTTYRNSKEDVRKELIKHDEVPDGKITLSDLQQYVGRDDTVAMIAAKALKVHSLISRVKEGTFESLLPHRDDLMDVIGGHDRLTSSTDESLLDLAFDNGRVAGANPDQDHAKVTQRATADTDAAWADSFPTLKELGIRNLHEQFRTREQQSLVFVRHVETANALPRILPGNIEVITGDVDREDQEDILDEYHAGTVDTIVMTYGVGTEGLDMSTATHVVLFGPPRSAEEHHNATGRVRRGDGPKFEHVLLYHDDEYDRQYARYEAALNSTFPETASEPSPPSDAVDAVTAVIPSN